MKTLKNIIVMILFTSFAFACTVDDTIEEQLNNQNNKEVFVTGEEDSGTVDEDKD
jgi:hypothetical protein